MKSSKQRVLEVIQFVLPTYNPLFDDEDKLNDILSHPSEHADLQLELELEFDRVITDEEWSSCIQIKDLISLLSKS